MNTLYIEPFSGLAGDMLLSALCGLADAYEEITDLPRLLKMPDGKVEIRELEKNGIVCKHVKITDLNRAPKPEKGGPLFHVQMSAAAAPAPFAPGFQPTVHRGLQEILQIIDRGSIPESAKKIAREIFMIIGRSEAKIHNMSLETIHFHEVSGVDSILDIVGCALLLDRLQISKTYADPVCTGHGMVKTQHGILPVPAPATADILQGLPTYKGPEAGEKVTPTGAAILRYLQPDFNLPRLVTEKIAYGPGEKNFEQPNVVRLSLVKPEKEAPQTERMYLLECNIDDTSPEYLGNDFQEQLLAQGAADFFFTPVQMKKGRPGLKLSVLTSVSGLDQLSNFVLENTSTIGLRYFAVDRHILKRRQYEVDTPYGPVKVKEVTKPSGRKSRKIEFESLRRISREQGLGLEQLQAELMPIVNKFPKD